MMSASNFPVGEQTAMMSTSEPSITHPALGFSREHIPGDIDELHISFTVAM